jgi:hypothetical protein
MASIAPMRATETAAPAISTSPNMQVLISVPEQRLAVVCDGQLVARYPVSTSRYGTGDNYGSYKTPLGQLRVCDKIGADLIPGAVIHHRAATGEVLPVNAPGRDPIVTRVIWLDGLESQNRNARSRGIYIHGTPEEKTIGVPASYGCIRMRSKDVIKVFDEVPVGTVVSILPDRLPHMHRFEPPKDQPAPSAPSAPDVPAGPAGPSLPPPVGSGPSSPPPPPGLAAAASPAPAKPAPQPPSSGRHEYVTPSYTERESTAALHAMKGSILLANMPVGVLEKPEDRHSGKSASAPQ